jgi:hypothetical protein
VMAQLNRLPIVVIRAQVDELSTVSMLQLLVFGNLELYKRMTLNIVVVAVGALHLGGMARGFDSSANM